MPSVFDNNVIRFQYPENWQVDRQDSEEGWTVSVQSPGTAFLLISCYMERPEVREVLQASLSAMQQDYPELEMEDATEKVAGHAGKGYDITFFSLDTLNSCKLRCFRTLSATFLILSQSSSFDSETNIAVVDAIRMTLQLTD
ncbi:MAG TPA: hypothetical protein PLN21_19095 [Gemmatales bacterium]|nr:hypothetical protein [Gemmatales bacterium]